MLVTTSCTDNVAHGTSRAGDAATVVEVIDGDTVDVETDDGQRHRVRLIGINSPERGECLEKEATAGLAELVGDSMVTMTADRSDRDRYGRLLRYLHTDGRFVNEAMVADGLAMARRYKPDTAQADRLDAAQERAQRSRVGLWAPDACGEPAVDAGEMVIGRLQFDAPGNDNNSLNGEWVEIVNRGEDDRDLTNWVLKDTSASHRYAFPAGFTLKAGAKVRVSSGCGTDRPDHLFWCVSGSAVWNNDGDTAYLLDPSGNIVDSRSYG